MLDKKINELDTAQTLLDTDLVLIGRPSDGKLFKLSFAGLRAALAGPQQLSLPGITVTALSTTTIDVLLSGDARAEQHVLRLADDTAFNHVIRNATLVAPQVAYHFTGLTPGTTYLIGCTDKATGFLDSEEAEDLVATNQVSNPGPQYGWALYYSDTDPWAGGTMAPAVSGMTLLKQGTISSLTADITIAAATPGFSNLIDSYWVLKLQKALPAPVQQVNDQFNTFSIPSSRYRNVLPEDSTSKYLVSLDLMGLGAGTDLTFKLQ